MGDATVRQRRRWLWLFAASLVVAGCGIHGLRILDMPRPSVRASWEHAGILDRRDEFAQVFCRNFDEASARLDPARTCRDWMWPIVSRRGVTTAPARLASAAEAPLPSSRTLVIIPGIFGECVAPWVTPFSQDHAQLEALGYRVTVVRVQGRASAALNAEIIHRHLSDPALDLRDAVVIAYSKGLTDFMLAASQPEAAAWRDKVHALVSVAGTSNGSPIANHAYKLYETWLAKLPVKHCGPSDGGGVRSLGYGVAMPIADAFAATPQRMKTYSVIAVAPDGTVNPMLAGFNDLLSRIDERNDGQVLMDDAVIPGSTVLGVFRADHWSIALPFEESDSLLMKPLSRKNTFPRGALVRAVLEFTAPVDRSQPVVAPPGS